MYFHAFDFTKWWLELSIHFIYVLSLGLDYKDFLNDYSQDFEKKMIL